jgi:hypothetical protein
MITVQYPGTLFIHGLQERPERPDSQAPSCHSGVSSVNILLFKLDNARLIIRKGDGERKDESNSDLVLRWPPGVAMMKTAHTA